MARRKKSKAALKKMSPKALAEWVAKQKKRKSDAAKKESLLKQAEKLV